MDLIYTTYAPKKKEIGTFKGVPLQSKWFFECANFCAVSTQNTVVFSSCYSSLPGEEEPQEDDFQSNFSTAKSKVHKSETGRRVGAANSRHFVYVCDLNTPWDVKKVTSFQYEVTALVWDIEYPDIFMVAAKDGSVEIWQMKNGLVNEWVCMAKPHFPNEVFLKATFIHSGKRAYMNMDKQESELFNEKFVFRNRSGVGRQFVHREQVSCVAISHTGLVFLITIPTTGPIGDQQQQQTCTTSLSPMRNRIKHTDISLLKNGSLIVAVSNGDPKSMVEFFRLTTGLEESRCGISELTLKSANFPGLFLQANSSKTDVCQSVVDLQFVTGDDCDAILVATQHPAGGRVELWELREMQHIVHKMFQPADTQKPKSLALPAWQYVEVFSGPCAQVVGLSTPLSSFQTGRAAACYVTVAYSDGSIQCLLRDNLQQIGSVDLPKTGNMCEEPSSKMSRTSVTICDMAFTATGNALLAIDSLGQLYIYRMSPIRDPGGLHVPRIILPNLEYCLVSGYDWWDVAICTKSSQIETVCDKLTEAFNKQPLNTQQYYYNRYMAMKSSLYRLCPNADYKAADCHALLMLNAAHGTFHAILRPSDMSMSEQSPMEKVAFILHNKKKDEADVDKLVTAIQSIHKEFAVEPSVLQACQHLIQWITNLALHLMASVPEYKHRRGPGFDLISDKKNLNTLRELLFLIRIWGTQRNAIIPHYTKSADSFDVVAKLFSLITRFKEVPSDEAILDECVLLPSQVMIPPMDTWLTARGVCPALVTYNKSLLCYEFGIEPDGEEGGFDSNLMSGGDLALIEGAMTSRQMMDVVRHIYVGKKPFEIRQCSRCSANSLNSTQDAKASNKTWDKRWLDKCPCGGQWKLTCLKVPAMKDFLYTGMNRT